jgi:hypothetical protein
MNIVGGMFNLEGKRSLLFSFFYLFTSIRNFLILSIRRHHLQVLCYQFELLQYVLLSLVINLVRELPDLALNAASRVDQTYQLAEMRVECDKKLVSLLGIFVFDACL